MSSLSEFSEGDIVKILVEEDEIEEECLATVNSINAPKLYVNYLTERSKFYKDAVIYTYEDHTNEVEIESISEHYKDVKNLHEIGFVEIEEGWYVKEDEIDRECSDSDIDDLSSEEDNDFIAEEDVSQWELPEDHEKIDGDWRMWNPRTDGERHYKNVVDRIEQYAKIYKDTMEF